MEKRDNYAIQAEQAKRCFLGYDQQKLIEKLGLRADEGYLYVKMLSETYRISRSSGDMERQHRGKWVDAGSHPEVMTLLDFVCDSRPNRYLSHRWKQMQAFGLMFHQNLLEERRDPLAEKFQQDPQALRGASPGRCSLCHRAVRRAVHRPAVLGGG